MGNEAGLVAYYPFNVGTAGGDNTAVTTAIDASVNGLNGTLSGFALTGSTSNWVEGVSTSVTVTANPSNAITTGTSVTFTATSLKGGTAPSYQWMLNGSNVGTNSSTYTNSNLADGDVVTVELTNTDPCANGANATSDPITMSVTPLANNGLHFDGVDDGVSVPDNNLLDLNTSFTLEAWINVDAYQPASSPQFGISGIITKNRSAGGTGYGLALTDRDNITFMANNGSGGNFELRAAASIPLNTWTHVAATRDGNTVRLYINGVEVASGTLSFNLFNSAEPFNIGRFGGGATGSWRLNGAIDEVRAWNIARSAAEIIATKDCELVGNEAGLVAYYPFNVGTAGGDNTAVTTAIDASVNGLNGTLAGFALTGSTSNWVEGVSTSVTIAANPGNAITTGTSVTFTATSLKGGTAPSYQWRLNGSNVGTNSSTYTNSNLADGDVVTVELTNTDPCANGANATSDPITMSVTPLANNGLHFDGVDDNISINHDPILNITGAITAEAWIKTSNNNPQHILTKSEDGLYMATSVTGPVGKLNIFLLGVTSGWVISNTTVCDGQWHHVAFTRSGNTFNLYIDGTLDKTQSVGTGVISSGSSPLRIGLRSPSSLVFFLGEMDEVRLWNIARSAAEIAAAKDCELVGNEAGLVAYYPFNLGTAGGDNTAVTTAIDASVNGLNGTLSGFALTGNTSNWVEGASTSVTIAANPGNSINAGANVTFTATPFKGGTTPSYQWKLNGSSVGTNSNTFSSSSLADGDVVTVDLTNACNIDPTATSNSITMSVAALPVEFLSFTGRAIEAGNQLQWITATEENNEGFQVQRSHNGRDFRTIGWVAGAGTTLETQHYTFTDHEPLLGTAYYRLQQVDYDGTTDFSGVISIARSSTADGFKLYPNPVTDHLTLENAQGVATLFNALGQPVQQFQITASTHTIDCSTLPNGAYTLHIQGHDGHTITRQIIK